MFVVLEIHWSAVADLGFLKVQWQLEFWKRVSAWQNTSPVWVEDQKKRSSTFILLFQQSFLHYYWIISNKTTVIGASQSDCSIRESRSDCSIKVYEFQKGISVETLKPPLHPPLEWSLFQKCYLNFSGITINTTRVLLLKLCGDSKRNTVNQLIINLLELLSRE